MIEAAVVRYVSVSSRRKTHIRSAALRRDKPTARAKTAAVYVSSPTVPGHREQVHRVVNTLDNLLKARQISEASYRAGERYRNAWDVLNRSPGGAMDFDRVRGGIPGSRAPTPAEFVATETISQCRQWLYRTDYEIVHLVVGEGHSIKTAAAVVDKTPDETGRCLRQALNVLAEKWEIDRTQRRSSDKPRITARRFFDPRETASSTEGEIRRGKVAHAGRLGVKFTTGS